MLEGRVGWPRSLWFGESGSRDTRASAKRERWQSGWIPRVSRHANQFSSSLLSIGIIIRDFDRFGHFGGGDFSATDKAGPRFRHFFTIFLHFARSLSHFVVFTIKANADWRPQAPFFPCSSNSCILRYLARTVPVSLRAIPESTTSLCKSGYMASTSEMSDESTMLISTDDAKAVKSCVVPPM
jgi:hypothetical protein